MRLYQIERCPFAHRARMALNEKQLEYSVVYFESKHRPSELVSASPDARSPTLFDEAHSAWVWDSSVVVEYLEDRSPAPALLPHDPALRARARSWMREVDAKLGPSSGPLSEEFVHKPPEERDASKADQLLPRLHQGLGVWEGRLDKAEFLLGSAFTLPDIWLYAPLFSVSGLVGWDRVIPAELPRLRQWRTRVAERASTAY